MNCAVATLGGAGDSNARSQYPEHSAHQRDRSSPDRGVDPAVRVTDAGGWFDGEIRDTWPAYTAARYLAPGSTGQGTREQRDRLLADAEIILGGWPYPLDLRARAPRLKWFHQRPAGASNLRLGDLWGSDVTVTTSRGAGSTLAIAEYAVAAILVFRERLQSHRRRSPGRDVRSSRLPLAVARRQDRLRRRRRRHRPRCRPALRRRSACGSSAPGAARSRASPCRPGSPRSAAAGGPRPLSAAQRFCRDLLPMDAGNRPAVRCRALCADETGQRAGQCRARRDRRRGGARRRAPSAITCAASHSTSMSANSSIRRHSTSGLTRECW